MTREDRVGKVDGADEEVFRMTADTLTLDGQRKENGAFHRGVLVTVEMELLLNVGRFDVDEVRGWS